MHHGSMKINSMPTNPSCLFIKLGGSLITDKRATETARTAVICRLAREIAQVRQQNPGLDLVLGHGCTIRRGGTVLPPQPMPPHG